jgi:hypothetical protein
MCDTYKRLRPNVARLHSTIHRENTQAVVTTFVASRLLSSTSNQLAAGLLGLESNWVRGRDCWHQLNERRVPCIAYDVTGSWWQII